MQLTCANLENESHLVALSLKVPVACCFFNKLCIAWKVREQSWQSKKKCTIYSQKQ